MRRRSQLNSRPQREATHYPSLALVHEFPMQTPQFPMMSPSELTVRDPVHHQRKSAPLTPASPRARTHQLTRKDTEFQMGALTDTTIKSTVAVKRKKTPSV